MTSTYYKHGFVVTPKSSEQINYLASVLREKIGVSGKFPIIECLELIHWDYEILTKQEMGNNLGLTRPDGVILLREDVYDGACDGNGRDRFTIAHELGHAVMHLNQMGFARAFNPQTDKPYVNCEWQANEFAGALLVPKHEVIEAHIFESEVIVLNYGVSYECAERRLKKIWGS